MADDELYLEPWEIRPHWKHPAVAACELESDLKVSTSFGDTTTDVPFIFMSVESNARPAAIYTIALDESEAGDYWLWVSLNLVDSVSKPLLAVTMGAITTEWLVSPPFDGETLEWLRCPTPFTLGAGSSEVRVEHCSPLIRMASLWIGRENRPPPGYIDVDKLPPPADLRAAAPACSSPNGTRAKPPWHRFRHDRDDGLRERQRKAFVMHGTRPATPEPEIVERNPVFSFDVSSGSAYFVPAQGQRITDAMAPLTESTMQADQDLLPTSVDVSADDDPDPDLRFDGADAQLVDRLFQGKRRMQMADELASHPRVERIADARARLKQELDGVRTEAFAARSSSNARCVRAIERSFETARAALANHDSH